ncbi:MAG: type II toxin-antitoxin system VapC family toxin [Acidimicrobiia bacterium]
MILVVDASAIVSSLTDPGKRGAEARSILVEPDLLAPYLVDLEVAQGFRRVGLLSSADMTEALHRYRRLLIRRFEHLPLLPRIWELRHNLTAYDAAYVALAEATGAPLVTADRKLASTPGHRAEVIAV